MSRPGITVGGRDKRAKVRPRTGSRSRSRIQQWELFTPNDRSVRASPDLADLCHDIGVIKAEAQDIVRKHRCGQRSSYSPFSARYA